MTGPVSVVHEHRFCGARLPDWAYVQTIVDERSGSVEVKVFDRDSGSWEIDTVRAWSDRVQGDGLEFVLCDVVADLLDVLRPDAPELDWLDVAERFEAGAT
jgi:hypothetical protein